MLRSELYGRVQTQCKGIRKLVVQVENASTVRFQLTSYSTVALHNLLVTKAPSKLLNEVFVILMALDG